MRGALALALGITGCLHVESNERHEYLCEARYVCDGNEAVALYGPIAADEDDARALVVLLCADTVKRLHCEPCVITCAPIEGEPYERF